MFVSGKNGLSLGELRFVRSALTQVKWMYNYMNFLLFKQVDPVSLVFVIKQQKSRNKLFLLSVNNCASREYTEILST